MVRLRFGIVFRLFFLPEAHTDFLFSILAEELGVIGAAILIATFFAIVIRALFIGRRAHMKQAFFHAYVAYGIALLLGIQAAINIGVNIGLLPTKGLTLPLVSFGGNSLIVSCLLIGVPRLNLAWEKLKKRLVRRTNDPELEPGGHNVKSNLSSIASA